MVTLMFKCKTVVVHEKASTIIFNPIACENNIGFFRNFPSGEISLVDIKPEEAKQFTPGKEYFMYLEAAAID
jgi:hypothetical protein